MGWGQMTFPPTLPRQSTYLFTYLAAQGAERLLTARSILLVWRNQCGTVEVVILESRPRQCIVTFNYSEGRRLCHWHASIIVAFFQSPFWCLYCRDIFAFWQIGIVVLKPVFCVTFFLLSILNSSLCALAAARFAHSIHAPCSMCSLLLFLC